MWRPGVLARFCGIFCEEKAGFAADEGERFRGRRGGAGWFGAR
ncbi:hypothetical protein STTU_3411 [Streptomyces sp. Tu6071]|nr:hypothetical protein STTU_3411 [Streptomyces sp. Tu6071]